MSVIWEAKCRMCRRAGRKLFLKGERCVSKNCAIEKESRRKPPGQHGGERRDRKVTQYALQLREKQNLKRMYQLRETQFANYMSEAQRRRGVTGENLLQLLETRLDNVVYRLGWTTARGASRQMVSHGFVAVNGKPVNIPSYQVRPNDVVTLREAKRGTKMAVEAIKRLAVAPRPQWLSMDLNTLEGRVVSVPARDQIEADIQEQIIVEYYTR